VTKTGIPEIDRLSEAEMRSTLETIFMWMYYDYDDDAYGSTGSDDY
jgi:hypothetical protein